MVLHESGRLGRVLVASAVVASGLVAGCSRSTPDDPASISSITTLGVPGAQNRGVSVAAIGQDVVVTWAATVGSGTDVYAAVSHDAGRSFAPAVRVNDLPGDARATGEQSPRVAIGTNIVVAWESAADGLAQVRRATSTDGGQSFTAATTVNGDGVNGPRGWASLAMDSAGVAHVAWLDARRDDVHARSAKSVSEDSALRTGAHVHGAGESMEQSVFYANSAMAEARVARGACFCCKTSVAIAPDKTVYLAWRHVYPTNLRDIAVARSTDGGRTFSDPVRVSEDHWQIDGCPEDGPSLAVDAGGVVHIAWPTFVQDTSRKGVFYSYSTDGGRTFASRARVDADDTATAAHPQIAVTGSRVVVVWDESAGPSTRVRSRAFVADADRRAWSPERSAPVASAEDVAEYPAIAFAGSDQIVAWTSGSEVRVRSSAR